MKKLRSKTLHRYQKNPGWDPADSKNEFYEMKTSKKLNQRASSEKKKFEKSRTQLLKPFSTSIEEIISHTGSKNNHRHWQRVGKRFDFTENQKNFKKPKSFEDVF